MPPQPTAIDDAANSEFWTDLYRISPNLMGQMAWEKRRRWPKGCDLTIGSSLGCGLLHRIRGTDAQLDSETKRGIIGNALEYVDNICTTSQKVWTSEVLKWQ